MQRSFFFVVMVGALNIALAGCGGGGSGSSNPTTVTPQATAQASATSTIQSSGSGGLGLPTITNVLFGGTSDIGYTVGGSASQIFTVSVGATNFAQLPVPSGKTPVLFITEMFNTGPSVSFSNIPMQVNIVSSLFAVNSTYYAYYFFSQNGTFQMTSQSPVSATANPYVCFGCSPAPPTNSAAVSFTPSLLDGVTQTAGQVGGVIITSN